MFKKDDKKVPMGAVASRDQDDARKNLSTDSAAAEPSTLEEAIQKSWEFLYNLVDAVARFKKEDKDLLAQIGAILYQLEMKYFHRVVWRGNQNASSQVQSPEQSGQAKPISKAKG